MNMICKSTDPSPTVRKTPIGYMAVIRCYNPRYASLEKEHQIWSLTKRHAAKAALKWKRNHTASDESLDHRGMAGVPIEDILDEDDYRLAKDIRKARKQLKRDMKHGSEPTN